MSDLQLQSKLELAIEEAVQSKVDAAKRKQDFSMMQQILEPLAESIEELTQTINTVKKGEQDYYDKDFNKNISSVLAKIVGFLGQFKTDLNIDLSPINSIAAEIKNQNTSILSLLSRANNGQGDEIYRMVTALIGKQNAFLEKSFETVDYSKQLQSISDEISKKGSMVEKLTVVYGQYDNRIKEVIPVYKNK